jgi:5'(3')-deoxyribonucleotidase
LPPWMTRQCLPISTSWLLSRCPEEHDLDAALACMRNKGKADDLTDPTAEFTKFDNVLPKKRGQSSKHRAREIEAALDWLRHKGVRPSDEEGLSSLDKVGSLPVSCRNPEERAKTVDDTLNWLRNKGKDDETTDPPGEFRKLDQLLPQKRDETPESRARDIESALDWMRNNVVSPHDEDAVEKFTKVGSVPTTRHTPEQREKDLENKLEWLRNKGKDVPKNTRAAFEGFGEHARLVA